jgi:HAD superfamily hydrolase (TIGR01459 family)
MHDLSERYPVWFCDVWGVVHDGYRPYAAAVSALVEHRRGGGIAILLTNSPRSSRAVERQLDGIGVDRAGYDSLVSSGEVTRTLVASHGGGRVYHLGAERDRSIFGGLEVARTSLDEAHAVVCTGLIDDRHETPGDYTGLLHDMRRRSLVMICANPDKIVRKGERILYCAGSLAEAYGALGGEVLMAGKPFRPIYDVAAAEVARLRGREPAREEMLAIGDGPETDIQGAADYGIDAVLVADGIIDASAGLAAVEAKVRGLVPAARIVRTVRRLVWS